MTLSEFNKLDLKEQLDITWDHGKLADNITHDRYYYLLYDVYGFFVEIAFNLENDEIVGLSSFS